MELKKRAISSVKWASISTTVTTCVSVLSTIILARFLSPVDFGLMSMVAVVIGFAQTYADLGISAAIIHRQDTTKEQLSTLYWLNIFAGILTFASVWLIVPYVGGFFREPRLILLIRVVSIVLIIIPAGAQFEILLRKELSFNILAFQEIVSGIFGFSIAVTCASKGFGVWALVWSFLGNSIMRTLFLVVVGLVRFRPSFHFRKSEIGGFISFGLYQMGERIINYLGETTDRILIGSLLGARELGFYYFAFNLVAQPISRINPIITNVAFPVFSRVQHQADTLRNGYIKVVHLLASINAPLLIGFAAVAPIAVPYIFGEKWSESIILIEILSFVSLSRSIGNPVGSLILAKGRADLGFKWNVVFLIVSVPMTCLGGILGKGVGVAVSLLCMQIVLQVPSYIYLIRPIIGECSKAYANAIMKPVMIACMMGLFVMGTSYFVSTVSNVLKLCIQIGIGGVAYLLLLWKLDGKIFSEIRKVLMTRRSIPM